MKEMRCRLLKGFYTADWYKDYKNHVSVEVWGRYDKDTDEIVDYQLRIHQSIVDSCSGYKTLEEVETLYEERKEYFSKEYSHVEQREKVTEYYETLKKQSQEVKEMVGYWLCSRFNDKGNIFTQIWEASEVDFPTPACAYYEGYDEYWDRYDTLEEAQEAEREAKEA